MRNLASIYDISRLLRALVSKKATYRKSKTFTLNADDWSSFTLIHFAYSFPNFYRGGQNVRNG